MRCVKCNMELSEGSRFCEYCGAPQPEQPGVIPPVQARKMYCGVCGRELPFGSRFCTYCGSPQAEQRVMPYAPGQRAEAPAAPGAVPPHAMPPGQYHTPADEPDKNNKKLMILIGVIAGVGVLLLTAIALTVFFVGRNKKNEWEENERRRQEEEIEREEEREEAEEEELEEIGQIEEEPEEEEPRDETVEEQEPESESSGTEVDFKEISYIPEDQPYDVMTEDEVVAFVDRMKGIEITTEDSAEGTIHSISGYKDLDVKAYYEPGTDNIRTIITLEATMSQTIGLIYIFENEELLMVQRSTYQGSSEPQYVNNYYFAKKCMIAEQTAFSGLDSSWVLLRRDLDSASDYDRKDFFEDEADYYNRAYKLYDAVSCW